MDQTKFFEQVVEPSIERLGLFGISHDVNFDGRHFVVTHKVSKNVFTEFDRQLSLYLAAVTGVGLPAATVETRIRDTVADRAWSPYPSRHLPSVPDALATAAKLALGSEPQLRVRFGTWTSEEGLPYTERLITTESMMALDRAMTIARQVGAIEFLDLSGDLDRVMLRPHDARLDMLVMDIERGTISVPTAAEMSGVAYQGPLFGFDQAMKEAPAVNTYLSRVRHLIAIAKENAIYDFRAAAEQRISRFDEALGGRDLTGYRLDSARSLVSRLQAGLGDTLLGLSEAAQLTALDWASDVRQLPDMRDSGNGDGGGAPNRPRLVR